MGRRCEVTGRGTIAGNTVSHSHKKTKRTFKLNLVTKKIYLPDEKRWVTMTLSTRALRTLRKKGVKAAMAKYGQELKK